MPNQNKIDIVKNTEKKINESVALYFTKYTGMNVVQATEFRKVCRETSVEYSFVKNTLIKIAAKNAGFENIFDELLEGQIGIATSVDDPIAPARIIKNFNKDNNDVLEVVGVFVDGNLYDPEKYKALANLPTREELITKFASMLNQPMSNLASVLNATMNKLAGTLKSLEEQKQ